MKENSWVGDEEVDGGDDVVSGGSGSGWCCCLLSSNLMNFASSSSWFFFFFCFSSALSLIFGWYWVLFMLNVVDHQEERRDKEIMKQCRIERVGGLLSMCSFELKLSFAHNANKYIYGVHNC